MIYYSDLIKLVTGIILKILKNIYTKIYLNDIMQMKNKIELKGSKRWGI